MKREEITARLEELMEQKHRIYKTVKNSSDEETILELATDILALSEAIEIVKKS